MTLRLGCDTRTPTWLVVVDTQSIGATTGLTEAALHGGEADTQTARIWLDDGRAPSGVHGRAFTDTSVHGFDLTFAAPARGAIGACSSTTTCTRVVATAVHDRVDAGERG